MLLKIFLINLNLLSIYKNLKICVMKSIAFYQNTDIFFEFLELKNKYHRLTVKNKNEQKIVRQLSSCLIEKYSGFTQISLEYKKKQRKLFKPIDIIYKPTKRIEIEPLCFFSNDLSKAYSSLYSSGENIKRAHKCYQCYYCNKFLFSHINKKDILKIVQEYQGSFTILIIKI